MCGGGGEGRGVSTQGLAAAASNVCCQRYCIFALSMGGGVALPDALIPCVMCCKHTLSCVLPPPPLSLCTITCGLTVSCCAVL